MCCNTFIIALASKKVDNTEHGQNYQYDIPDTHYFASTGLRNMFIIADSPAAIAAISSALPADTVETLAKPAIANDRAACKNVLSARTIKACTCASVIIFSLLVPLIFLR